MTDADKIEALRAALQGVASLLERADSPTLNQAAESVWQTLLETA
jgi:hypothetical protein